MQSFFLFSQKRFELLSFELAQPLEGILFIDRHDSRPPIFSHVMIKLIISHREITHQR